MSERDRDRRGDRRDPPRKTWRELDATRDKPRSQSAPPPRQAREEERASKQHRAALEAMFAKGEVGKLIADKLNPPAPAPTTPRTPVPVAPQAPAAQAAPDPNSRAALRKKIVDAVGRDEITRAVDKYVEKHGMPAEFELLEQGLEHSREERVVEMLDALEKLLEREKPKRSRALAGKLRFLEETSHDADLRARAAAIRGKLG